MQVFDWCLKLANRSSSALAICGAMGLLLATLITCSSIILKLIRRTLDALLAGFINPDHWSWIRPILGEEELVQFAVAIALFSALPWVMLNKGHIRVELLRPVFGQQINRWLDVLADIALTAIAYLIMTRQWELIFRRTRSSQESPLQLLLSGNTTELVDRMRMSQESQILGLPLWPFHIAAEACVIVFFIIGLLCIVRSIKALWSASTADADDTADTR